jgi:hypothetical protein
VLWGEVKEIHEIVIVRAVIADPSGDFGSKGEAACVAFAAGTHDHQCE